MLWMHTVKKNDSRKFNEEYKKNLVLSADKLRESIIAGRMRIYSSQNQFTQAFMKNHHVYTWQSAQRKQVYTITIYGCVLFLF